MGIVDKIKQFFGIGGVKLVLQAPESVQKASGKVDGKVTLTSKSDQKVLSFTYWLEQRQTIGKGQSKQVKTHKLAEKVVPNAFEIKTGETKEVSFSLPLSKSGDLEKNMAQENGVFGAIAKMGQAVDQLKGQRYEYYLWVSCDVDGVTMDPNASQKIQLV